jgi:hypothetical protein
VALWAVLASVLVLQTRSQVLGDVFLYVSVLFSGSVGS